MKLFCIAALAAICACFAACATAPTPAQIAAVLCTPADSAVATIKDLAITNPSNPTLVTASAALKKIQPTLDGACAAATTVTSDSVQNLITVGLPALGTILGTLPLPAATLATIETDFTLAEATINMVDVVVTNIQNAQKVASVMAPTPLAGVPLK